MNLKELTISSIQEGLFTKEFSAVELVKETLREIERRDNILHAFLETTPELALSLAKEADEKVRRGEKSPLLGVPCSVKDAILVEGVSCTAGSRMLENYIAPYDATVIEKLKEAGSVIVGKTNMDEFGMGASTENSAFGPTKNPADIKRVPGGSSGGSAASVASGESVIALGEDTGGSIRQPASFCGVVGLKPTYGTVSRYGVIALASSLDQVGPFARNVQDAEILFKAIRGKDSRDATSVEYPVQKNGGKRNLTVGVPKEYFSEGLDPAVEKTVREAIEKLKAQGVSVVEVELPNTKYALAAYYVINTSEASSNLARYDGVRYGAHKEAENLLEEYLVSRGDSLGAEVKRRIMLGTFALSAGYYEAYYLKAQKIRTLLQEDFAKAFEKADVLLGPTAPTLPFLLGEKTQDPLAMYLVDVYTVPANLVGLCAISVPAGSVGNLPVGLQIIAPAFQEHRLFSTGKMLENM